MLRYILFRMNGEQDLALRCVVFFVVGFFIALQTVVPGLLLYVSFASLLCFLESSFLSCSMIFIMRRCFVGTLFLAASATMYVHMFQRISMIYNLNHLPFQ